MGAMNGAGGRFINIELSVRMVAMRELSVRMVAMHEGGIRRGWSDDELWLIWRRTQNWTEVNLKTCAAFTGRG